MIGISPEKFDELIKKLKPLWTRAENKRKRSYVRKIKIGGGNRYKLSFEQMVSMYLMHVRTYVNHIFLGSIFNIDNSRVYRYFQKLRPVIHAKMETLIIEKVHISEQEILDMITDATEQEAERNRVGSAYSGKKKKTTVKTQITVDKKGRIKHVSHSVPGNIHDKKLYDQTGLHLPGSLADLGYVGTELKLPHKSSKLHPLTKRQKQQNKKHATKRIVVEHVFAQLKKYQILNQRYRGKLDHYNETFVIVCGLRNFISA